MGTKRTKKEFREYNEYHDRPFGLKWGTAFAMDGATRFLINDFHEKEALSTRR